LIKKPLTLWGLSGFFVRFANDYHIHYACKKRMPDSAFESGILFSCFLLTPDFDNAPP
jgi:hypothetical protein